MQLQQYLNNQDDTSTGENHFKKFTFVPLYYNHSTLDVVVTESMRSRLRIMTEKVKQNLTSTLVTSLPVKVRTPNLKQYSWLHYTSTQQGLKCVPQTLYHKCSTCLKQFKTLSTFNHHKCTTSTKAQCDRCQKVFSQKSTLDTHIKLVHLKIRDFKCDICEKYFGSKNDRKKTH